MIDNIITNTLLAGAVRANFSRDRSPRKKSRKHELR